MLSYNTRISQWFQNFFCTLGNLTKYQWLYLILRDSNLIALGYALKSFESFRKLPDDPNVQTTLGTTGIIESLENTKNKKDILLKKLKKNLLAEFSKKNYQRFSLLVKVKLLALQLYILELNLSSVFVAMCSCLKSCHEQGHRESRK